MAVTGGGCATITCFLLPREGYELLVEVISAGLLPSSVKEVHATQLLIFYLMSLLPLSGLHKDVMPWQNPHVNCKAKPVVTKEQLDLFE